MGTEFCLLYEAHQRTIFTTHSISNQSTAGRKQVINACQTALQEKQYCIPRSSVLTEAMPFPIKVTQFKDTVLPQIQFGIRGKNLTYFILTLPFTKTEVERRTVTYQICDNISSTSFKYFLQRELNTYRYRLKRVTLPGILTATEKTLLHRETRSREGPPLNIIPATQANRGGGSAIRRICKISVYQS